MMDAAPDPSIRDLNDCDCCEGVQEETPVQIDNRPGLSAVAYRVGTHSRFKRSMLAALSSEDRPELQGLKTREDDDFFIALLDGWATVADVLTFYQERIIQESFWRTATERFSLLQHARMIGYQPRPGVAAGVYLAFTVESAKGAPQHATIDIGTKVQSLPGPGEQPQFYETVEKIEAQAAWNDLKVKTTEPQDLKSNTILLYFAGTTTNLRAGDGLLFTPSDTTQPLFAQVKAVTAQPDLDRTRVEIRTFALPADSPSVGFTITPYHPQYQPAAFLGTYLGNVYTSTMWLAVAVIGNFIAKDAFTNLSQTQPLPPGVYAFRARAGIFGNTAPPLASLKNTSGTTAYNSRTDASWVDNGTLMGLTAYYGSNDKKVILDNVYPGIAKDGWVVLKEGTTWTYFRVDDVEEISKAEFAITAKCTRLTIDRQPAGSFHPRLTTVFGQSETLALTTMPITTPVEGDYIDLASLVAGLVAGQTIMVCGERDDMRGVNVCEVRVIQEVSYHISAGERFTTLRLTKALTHQYVRDTVTISANVAFATHGETKVEVLGSGDGGKIYQTFTLQNSPLTYISAASSTGIASTLQVWVDNLLWQEVNTLYGHGPSERIYVTETADDGKTTIRFGDGISGARLPSGRDNVKAIYRKGSGRVGKAQPDQINQLMTRPLGVKAVTNPVVTDGGVDPEGRDQMRRSAPVTVLTLGRIVSLRDYEDFALSFAGVAKAQAVWAVHGRSRGVFLTVAGDQGDPINEGDLIYDNLLSAIRQASEPHVPVRVKSYRKRTFCLSAGYKRRPDTDPLVVEAAIIHALRVYFAFDARQFGDAVDQSEVIALIQSVPGVVAVDLNQLYRTDNLALLNSLQSRLTAESPKPGSEASAAQGAELLTLDPLPVVLTVMT